MRFPRVAVALIALCVLAPGPGPAGADLQAPHTALTGDGHGVLVGSAEAPAQLEIFCEPQCPRCAEFEADSASDLGRALGDGRLAVTYRWLTVLDEKRHTDVSARAATALMAAADPATPATAYQAFVADLYRHQDPHDGPPVDEIAEMATESGVPAAVVAVIAAGTPVVDTAAMTADNRARLSRQNPNPGTPTVYDRATGTVVDAHDPGWLGALVGRV
jgi:hypothetical protein